MAVIDHDKENDMELAAVLQDYGIGVMATADGEGNVNTAVYARPHIVDANTLVWGMSDGRSFHNLKQNPRAAYLLKQSGPGFRGARIALELLRIEAEGEMLEEIRRRTNEVVGPGAGRAVSHAAWFRIVEIRPLI